MIQIDARIANRLTSLKKKDEGRYLTSHLTKMNVNRFPGFPKVVESIVGATVCAYVRMGTANRVIEGVPETRLERTITDPLMQDCPVVMGMTAYRQFGHTLREARLFVATRDPMGATFMGDGEVTFYRTPKLALDAALRDVQETECGPVWVRGGAYTFAEVWDHVSHVLALKTRGTFEGTAMFPKTPLTEWNTVLTQALRTPRGEDTEFTISTLKRKPHQ